MKKFNSYNLNGLIFLLYVVLHQCPNLLVINECRDWLFHLRILAITVGSIRTSPFGLKAPSFKVFLPNKQLLLFLLFLIYFKL